MTMSIETCKVHMPEACVDYVGSVCPLCDALARVECLEDLTEPDPE